jgi:hypothetical protein
VTGRIAPSSDLVGTALDIDAAGPDASTFGRLLRQPSLPAAPFSVSGSVEIGETGYRLTSVVVELAGNRATIDGTVSASENLSGTDLQLAFAAPDLGAVGQLVSQTGLIELPELPREPFSISGSVTIDDEGHELRSVEGTLGAASGRVDGRLGFPPGFRGTDLTVHADGPNASLFPAATGVSVPAAPFRVDGRVERLDEGFRFHDVRVELGEYRAQAHGRLGELPKLIGSDFEMHAEGPSLSFFSQLTGIANLPDQPFEITGTFDGNPSRFKADRFDARVGDSDVRGAFRVDLEARPTVHADLRSDRIDLTRLRVRHQAGVDDERTGPGPPPPPRTLLISDQPLRLGVLRAVDADVTWNVAELATPLERFRDLELDVSLHEGRFEAGPLTVIGSADARLDASLVLEPAGEAYTLETTFALDNAPLYFLGSERDPTRWPRVHIQVELTGTGRSAHQLASAADGRITFVAGPGEIDSSLAELFAADILVTLLEALNPFRKEDPSSELVCAVLVMDLEGGVGELDPMAIQTDKMTIVGQGRVDLATEKIGLDWVTKPRKGLGLSATAITNPYVRLGGTLGNPNIEMKPLEGLASTGIAVATGGLSLVGKGLLDRITAEQKVCELALKKVENRRQKKAETGK